MKKSIPILLFVCTFQVLYSQCDSLSIKWSYDEFDQSILNTSKIVLKNDEVVDFEIGISYHSSRLKGNRGFTAGIIEIRARLLNGGDIPKLVGDKPYVHFLFKDGTSKKLYGGPHIGPIFVSRIWLKSFDGKSRERLSILSAIKTMGLKAIRFNRTSENFDYYLTELQETEISKIFQCITQKNHG